MTYATVMAHLELGATNIGLLRIVADLTERSHASVIGVGVCRPLQNVYSNMGDWYISGAVVQPDREEIAREDKAAEAEFRDAMKGHAKQVEWRSAVTFSALSDYLVAQSRCADLIITGVSSSAVGAASRRADTTNLILQAGRPVLVVPAAADRLRLERIVIGWKDTREARRAAADALPLLKWATHTIVVEIAAEAELASARARLTDVVGWLDRHGVAASPVAARSCGADAAETLRNR